MLIIICALRKPERVLIIGVDTLIDDAEDVQDVHARRKLRFDLPAESRPVSATLLPVLVAVWPCYGADEPFRASLEFDTVLLTT